MNFQPIAVPPEGVSYQLMVAVGAAVAPSVNVPAPHLEAGVELRI